MANNPCPKCGSVIWWWRDELVAVAVFLLMLSSLPDASPQCSVSAAPRLSQAPLRFIRVKVQVQDRSGGMLSLDGPYGHETSSLIQAGVITTWIEWKNVTLLPGDYEIRLLGRCTARDHVTVIGN